MGLANFAVRLVTRFIPETVLERVCFKMLRVRSSEWRAFTDVLVPPYDGWAEWNSGLESGAHILYALVRATRPSRIVEIGSARGKSTCAMGLACRQNDKGKVYAIDPHNCNSWMEGQKAGETADILRGHIKDYELEKYVEVIQDTSGNAAREWSRRIDLLFIDGDHTYEGVRHDFEAFQPWLAENALVVFHDSLWEYNRDKFGYRDDIGVPRYLEELRQKGYHSVTLSVVHGLTLLHPTPGGFSFVPQEESDDERSGAGSAPDRGRNMDCTAR